MRFGRKRSKIKIKNHRSYRQPKIFSNRVFSENKEIKVPSWFYGGFILIMVVFGAVYCLFFSNIFAVKDVIIEGNNWLKAKEIADATPKGGNIFLFNSKSVKADLLHRFPEIKDLAIYRGIPNAIKIVVLERDSQLLWQSGDDKFLISGAGEVAKKVDDENGLSVPKVIDTKNIPVTPGTALISPGFVSFVTEVYNNFYNAVNIKPTYFEVGETTFDVTLHTEAGFAVKFDTLRSSQAQLENLKKVLVEKRDEIHEYVDLRINGWAYYK